MTATESATALDTALERGTRRLLELQCPEGYWVGELESNATMVAEHLFMLHFLGLRDAETDRKLANELLARRRADGTWAIWWDGPPDLSVTVEAYAALKLAGVDAGEATRAYISREGGIARTRIFTKAFLALLGQWPWHRMVNVPVELILAPPGAPLSVYDFACWARQTLVPLSVVMALKPVRPAGIDLSEIGARPGRNRRPFSNRVRRRAIRAAERWVRERQEADGSWGGIQPPWVWSLLMLAALGHNREDECFRRGIDGWAGFMIDEGDRLRPEACQSPVWDTGLVVLALRAAGVPADHPQLVKAGEWLLREEIRVKGDWAVRRPHLAPGGWAFEYQNDLYPDIDDTAVIALALRELGMGEDAVQRGLDWAAGMQSHERRLGRVRRRQHKGLDPADPVLRLRRGDRPTERGRDRPRAGGARAGARLRRRRAARARLPPRRAAAGRLVVGALGREPPLRDGRCAARARGLRDPAGSPGGAARARLARLRPARGRRLRRGHPLLLRSLAPWPRELRDAVADGLGAARLHRRRRGRVGPAQAAADYLCRAQRPDGDWDELAYTGTGFPLDFMIRYHLYRISFPMLALGRFRERGLDEVSAPLDSGDR